MTYSSCIERLLHTSASVKMRCDLSAMALFDKACGHAWKSYRTVHVAGSNGKGSVATKIAHALQCSGLRVGLYTSPHLFSFRERITVNGKWISKEDIASGLQEIFHLEDALGIKASFFEILTLLAFKLFQKEKVDIAIIETGLGGRWDATNVIVPICSVITSISKEHAHILGDDLEMIAAEKAGIIKEGVPVVLGPHARFKAIYQCAASVHAPLHFCNTNGPFYDEENSAIARTALEHLAFSIPSEAIAQGMLVRPACRFERIGDVLLDVAHNPDAILHLLRALHIFFEGKRLRFVVGFSSDKEYAACLQLISSVATHVHLVSAGTPRAATVQELAAVMQAPFGQHESIVEAVKEAHALARERAELLVITGSFYIMADAKEALGIYVERDTLALHETTLSLVSSSART